MSKEKLTARTLMKKSERARMRLCAQMLVENVKSGMALKSSFFDSSGVYAKYSIDGKLSFHIYPFVHCMGARSK